MLPPDHPFAWLNGVTAPKIIVQAVQLYGVKERPGLGSNPEILSWAKEIGSAGVYSGDEIPWCGLFMAVVAKRAGKPIPINPLWARNWSGWGKPVSIPEFGDVLVFQRNGGGHVAIYVGETHDAYAVLGGNQQDQVCIGLKPKADMIAARRFYAVAPPRNVRRVFLRADQSPISITKMD